MANYYGFTRTNYFAVKDEEAFRKAIASCRAAEDKIQIFEDHVNGQKVFGFGCYSQLSGIPATEDEDDCETDVDAFYDALQQILEDGHAVIITEVGYEKLRYLVGDCTIITSKGIHFVSLRDTALSKARELLGNAKYDPKMEY